MSADGPVVVQVPGEGAERVGAQLPQGGDLGGPLDSVLPPGGPRDFHGWMNGNTIISLTEKEMFGALTCATLNAPYCRRGVPETSVGK